MGKQQPKIDQLRVVSKSGNVIDFMNFIRGEQVQAKLEVQVASTLLGDRLALARVDFSLFTINVTEEELGKIVEEVKSESGDFLDLKEKAKDDIGVEYSIVYEIVFDVEGIEDWEDIITSESILNIVGPYINQQTTEFFREAGNIDFNLPFNFWQNR